LPITIVNPVAHYKGLRLPCRKIMGLHDWVAPTAWILTYAAMFLVVRPARPACRLCSRPACSCPALQARTVKGSACSERGAAMSRPSHICCHVTGSCAHTGLSPLTAGGAAAARQACLGVTAVCAASFLPTTAPSLLFALLAAFAAAQLAFGALLAAPLGNAKVAGVLAPAAHFVCLLPRYLFFRTGEAQVEPLPPTQPPTPPIPPPNHIAAATGS